MYRPYGIRHQNNPLRTVNYSLSVIVADFDTKFTVFTQEDPDNTCSKFCHNI